MRVSAAPSNTSASEFDAPSRLAFGGGHLWVTNEAGNSVTEIDPNSGTWIATFATSDYGFNRPMATTGVGPDLFIADGTGSVTEMRTGDGSIMPITSGPGYHFVNPVAISAMGNKILVLNAGRHAAHPPVAGSIRELDARTGAMVRTVSGARYSFKDPMALTPTGSDVFVADEASNPVTGVDMANGRLIRVVARRGLHAPDGIAAGGGQVWVSDSRSNAVTEIDRVTGAVLATLSNANGDYDFGSPSTAIASAESIFVASPYGNSPNGDVAICIQRKAKLVHVQHKWSVSLQSAVSSRSAG